MTRARALTATFTLLWVAAIATGFAALLDFDNRPGDAGEPPAAWPDGTALARRDGLPTLIMGLHPHCPCSRASLAELERIVARCRGRVQPLILLHAPAGAGLDWTLTDIRSRAASIHGVVLVTDLGGVESDRFGLRTSGHVLYYDSGGLLRFSGGITASRGHEGDSAGGRIILSLIDKMDRTIADAGIAPVFGCPLEERDACNRK